MQALTKDVTVHYVERRGDAEVRDRRTRKSLTTTTSAGFYDYRSNSIFVHDGISNPEAFAHIVFHEAVHAAAGKTMDRNPGFKLQVRSIMNEAEALGLKDPEFAKYAFDNEHEFLSEAWSNKRFRDLLASHDISPELRKKLAIGGWRNRTGFGAHLKTLWDAFKSSVANALGAPRAASFLEATLATTDRVLNEHEREMRATPELTRSGARTLQDRADPEKMLPFYAKMPEQLSDVADKLATATTGSAARRTGNFFKTSDQFRQAEERHFGAPDESNPLRQLVGSVERAGVRAREYKVAGDKLSARIYDLTRSNPEAAQEFSRLAEEATIHDVHLDRANPHLDPQELSHAQALAALPRMKADFAKLVASAPEARALWADTIKYFKDTHDAMASKLIDNHLEGLDAASVGGLAPLKQRILDGKMTDKDQALFSPAQGDALRSAKEVQNIKGAYFPLMRRGNYVVRALMKVGAAGGRKIGDNVVQFADAAAAKSYAEKSPLRTLKVSEHWVDRGDPSVVVRKVRPTPSRRIAS